jgi:outer membrane protein assembly factor BamB
LWCEGWGAVVIGKKNVPDGLCRLEKSISNPFLGGQTMWKMKLKRNLIIAVTAAVVLASLPNMALGDWPMAGANPQRTSWVSDEVSGQLYPQWYRPIEPFINMKTQIIAVDGVLYISTARGLYALDAADGGIEWVYPTEIPLGNAPTVVNGVAYVGSYDRTIHAIDAATGEDVSGWTGYEAEAGFETNPLVVNGIVYAGNRDGNFYAFDANTGDLEWSYQTDGPILFSAAYSDGVIYFASNDAHAYALDTDGELVWKSAKLPGSGFHSWWPVIYGNKVVFAGGHNYCFDQDLRLPDELHWTTQELDDVYKDHGTRRLGFRNSYL